MLLLAPVLCVVAFVTLPLLAIFLKVLPQEGLWETLREPLVTQALRLSLVTSLSSLLLALLCGGALVVVTGTHRGDAFAACEFIMDYLKTRAPFWKKEETPNGARWVESRASDEVAAERWRPKG